MQNKKDVIEKYKKNIELDSKDYKSLCLLAMVYDENKEFTKAIEYYLKSLDLTYYGYEEAVINLFELYFLKDGTINVNFEKKFLEHNKDKIDNNFLKYELLKLCENFTKQEEVKIETIVRKSQLFFMDGWLKNFLNRWLKYLTSTSKITAINELINALEGEREIGRMTNKELRDYLLYIHYYEFTDSIDQFYTVEFYEQIGDIVFVKEYVKQALDSKSESFCSSAVVLYERFSDKTLLEDEFNQFLVNSYHERHQELLGDLQVMKYSSSVPYLDQALTQGFDVFNVCSEDEVIAKWYSHALSSIDTKEAISVLEKHTHSENEEIAKEMSYRLGKQ